MKERLLDLLSGEEEEESRGEDVVKLMSVVLQAKALLR